LFHLSLNTMHRKIFWMILVFCLAQNLVSAQELHAVVKVVVPKVSPAVDRKIFQTLENDLTNFVNNRRWTNDAFQRQERIECIFTLRIENLGAEAFLFKGTLSVQAARPVYNTAYQAAVINYSDPDVMFKYRQYQPIEFNENRVQGTDAQIANLPALFAYYVYMILGFDYDSFAPKAGEPYFRKANNIVNNAPEGTGIAGWRIFDGARSRYWLSENLTNTRYNELHDVIYSYYRLALDNMYEKEAEARAAMIESLTLLQNFNKANANTMIVDFFMQGKLVELTGIFKKAPPDQRARAIEILSTIDVVNLGKYKDALK
jgi:hypothetical protein